MMRRFLVATLLVPLAAAAADGSANVTEIVDQLLLRHYYLEEGVEASIDDMEQLVANHTDVYFVALASEIAAGADSLAADLLTAVETGTVIVVTPTEAGAASSEHDDASLASALQAASEQSGESDVEYFEVFAEALPDVAPPPPVDPNEPSGGFPVVVVVVVVGVLALIVLTVWRGNRRRSENAAAQLEAARTEIRQQMDVIANRILEMGDDPRVADHAEALTYFRQGSETFQNAESRLVAATNLAQFEDLSDDLDRARWELETAAALAAGRPLPAPPETEKPPACFFDPTHGAGTEEAELKTAAGSQRVWVCAADAEKLRRGEAPAPRTIPMGPGHVPAPQAPRSHGGMGLDWLDVFSVIVGGMGNGVPYDWGGSRPRTQGPRIRLPSRGGSARQSSAPRSSAPRPKGRARRSR
jgi:type II secretory pathway pseudopilin PulG